MLDRLRHIEENFSERHGIYLGRVRLLFRGLIVLGCLLALVVATLVLPFSWLSDLAALTIVGLAAKLIHKQLKQRHARAPDEAKRDEAPAATTTVPQPARDADSPVELYNERRHWKFFVKKTIKPVSTGLALVAVGVIALIYTDSNLAIGVFVLALLLLAAVEALVIYRAWYEWQHFRLVITETTVEQQFPHSDWLFLSGPEVTIPTRELAWKFAKKTAAELAFRLKSRGLTIDSRLDEDKLLHNMEDVKDPDRLKEISRYLMQRQKSASQSSPEVIRDGIRLFVEEQQRGQRGDG